MAQIWKWTLDKPTRTIMAPAGATPLAVQMQDDVPTLWMQVDTAAPSVPHRYTIVATGQEFDRIDAGAYVGTLQIDGWFIGHVFLTPTASGEA